MPLVGGDAPMRGKRNEEKETTPALCLAKTVYTAMIIAGFICFLGAFFPVHQNEGEQADLVAYYLTWCLPYGIPCLLIALMGVLGVGNAELRPRFLKNAGISGIISGSLLMAGSFPLVIVFQAWEFFFSIMIIGACVLAMGIVQISAQKESK